MKEQKIKSEEIKNNLDKGVVFLPYVTLIEATTINGETVWYRNKWKNLLLKVKRVFVKPKYFNAKLHKQYMSKQINPSFYSEIKIENEN